MDKSFLESLESAQKIFGNKFRFTSGYRCGEYQKVLRNNGYPTAVGVSPHQKGVAVDITCSNTTRYKILRSLMDSGFNRFGIARSYIHADKDKERTQNYMWYYLH